MVIRLSCIKKLCKSVQRLKPKNRATILLLIFEIDNVYDHIIGSYDIIYLY